MRGWVCNLLVQLQMGLARAVTLGLKFLRTQDHISLSYLRPGGPGPCIYIPQEQVGPVIPPGTGIPLRCLLRLAGLDQVKVKVTLRLTVQSAIPSWYQAPIWDPRPIFPLLSLIIFRQLQGC
jgi:hypothetical protein